jgi:2-polyprenyl-3-methyl-5-hydroxy-6-metoxy-1,4-benzoquinol methylase
MPYDVAMPTGDILRDQIDYYRARAGEYDEWWFRTGRYDRGAQLNARWQAEVASVEATLDEWLTARAAGTLLELACGTGLFTRHLARRVPHITAVDASPEVLALNRDRVAEAAQVEYVEADLFSWRPAQRYDVVFFSFWLSHVPDARFAAFWQGVAAALNPGGAVYLIDSALDPSSMAKDHVLPRPETDIVARKLNDGREFHIVKHFWEPQALTTRLGELGWSAAIAQTPSYFIHGPAQRAS